VLKRPILFISVALFVLTGLSGCGAGSGPRAGDTVKPRFNDTPELTAGQPGQIGVRLVAVNSDGSGSRNLGFGGITAQDNPVAKIIFFQGEQPMSPPVEVVLSHRC
jgi:hypothetical protein